jgi:hypothetical protein
MQVREDSTASTRLVGKLTKKRGEETLAGLRAGIPEVEVVIDHGS